MIEFRTSLKYFNDYNVITILAKNSVTLVFTYNDELYRERIYVENGIEYIIFKNYRILANDYIYRVSQ